MRTASRARVCASIGFFLQGAVLAGIVTRLPAYQDRYGLSDGDVTLVLLAVALVAGAGSLLAERAAARWSSKHVLRVATAGIGAMAAVSAVSPSLVVFGVAIVAYGLALGAVDASMNMQGVALERLEDRSIMASFHAMWSIGGIVGALYAAGTAALHWPLGVAMAAFGTAAVVVALAAGPGLLARTAEPAPPVTNARTATPWREILLIGLVVAIFYVSDTGVMSWSSLYLERVLDTSSAVAPLGYACYQVGSVASRLLGDPLVRRYGARAVVRTAVAVACVALLALVLSAVPVLTIAAFGLLGLGFSVVVPLSFAAAGRVEGADVNATIARINISNYVGNISGAVLIGLVATFGGLRWIYLVPLVLVPVLFAVVRVFTGVRRPVPE